MRFSLICVLAFLLLLPVSVFAQEATPPGDIVAECAALLPADRPIPTGEDAPAIHIVAPAESIVYGTQLTVTIETTNFDLTSESRHWHLWLDGQLYGMVYQPTAILDLEPGTYQLCVSMGNTDHADLGMPAGMIVTLQYPAAGTPTPTPPVAPESARVLAEPGLGVGEIGLVMAAGVLAAVGGWWLGQRLPKARRPPASKS